jgi:hypothetical protein
MSWFPHCKRFSSFVQAEIGICRALSQMKAAISRAMATVTFAKRGARSTRF